MTTKTRVDFRQIRTVATLRQFAEKFPSWPLTWFRDWLFGPMFLGAAERPVFRVSRSLSDRGEIVCRDAAGELFRTCVARDLAALEEAARLAPDDATLAEGIAFLEARRTRASQSGKNGRGGVSVPAAPENRQERQSRTIPGRLGHVSGTEPLLTATPAPVAAESTPGGRRFRSRRRTNRDD